MHQSEMLFCKVDGHQALRSLSVKSLQGNQDNKPDIPPWAAPILALLHHEISASLGMGRQAADSGSMST